MNAQPTTIDLDALKQTVSELQEQIEHLIIQREHGHIELTPIPEDDEQPAWPDIDSAVFRQLRDYGECDPESLACKLITRDLKSAGICVEDLIVSIISHCEDYERELEYDGGFYTVDDPAMFIADVPHLGALPRAGADWRYKVGHFKYRQTLKQRGFTLAERFYGQYAEPYTAERAQIAYNSRRRIQSTKAPMESSHAA